MAQKTKPKQLPKLTDQVIHASVWVDLEDKVLRGQLDLDNTGDTVTFEATTITGLKGAYKLAVEQYLAYSMDSDGDDDADADPDDTSVPVITLHID